jgi:hypothetical protein
MELSRSSTDGEAEARAHLHMNHKWRSALEIIVAHEKLEFAQNELFNKLITSKWNKFGCRMYLHRTVFPYVTLLIIFMAVVILRGIEMNRDFNEEVFHFKSNSSVTSKYCLLAIADHQRSALYGDEATRASFLTTLILQAVVVVFGCPWLLYKGWRQRRLMMRDLDINEDGMFSLEEIQIFVYKNLHFALNFISAGALISAGVCRVLCHDREEANSMALASMFLFCNMLNVMMPFKAIGGLVITIYRMFIGGESSSS